MKQAIIRRSIWVAAIILAAVLFGGLSACQTNRTTGEQQFNLMSMEQEIEMGRDADIEISRSMGLYPDEKLQSYVSGIGLALAAESEWPKLPWSFKVVDDDTVNAFALPGGFIYVTRGILAHFNSEAQLAGVLGHEIGHVTARHASVRISKAQLMQLGLGLSMMLEPELQKIAPLAGAGMQLLFLSFSRTDESQSDELGVRYMAAAGYNPEPLIDVMETLRRVSEAGGEGRLPQWLASHPHPENRQQKIRGNIRDLGKREYSRGENRDEYLRKVDGVVFGTDPREGYVRDGVFNHPALRFSIQVPKGWTVINQKQAVVAVSPKKDAAVQLTISGETSIEAASRRLYAVEQVKGGGVTRTRINGLTAGIGPFKVATEQGPVDGTAAFIEYDGKIYQFIGYSASGSWAGYQGTVNAALLSFNRLTDRAAIEVEPLRVDLTRAGTSTSLRDLYAGYYRGLTPAVPIEQIALINQLQPDSRIEAGTYVKMVRGTTTR